VTMNTLYYSPGTCALGIHLLLEELGEPYRLEKVDTTRGEQHQADFLAVSRKAKVPALRRSDGSVLTEFPAIAYWLAVTHPEKSLFPRDPEAQARALEAMDYVVASLHMQGFTRVWRPQNFIENPAEHEAVKRRGQEICRKGIGLMDEALAGRDYLVGEFSIADAALFYFEFWLVSRLKWELPANCAGHYARVLARPSAKRALEQEGLTG